MKRKNHFNLFIKVLLRIFMLNLLINEMKSFDEVNDIFFILIIQRDFNIKFPLI